MPSELNSSGSSYQSVLPRISVFGIGGAGVNAVTSMILSQFDFDNVKFIIANTDCQSLDNSPANIKIQLGTECTKGLGAGSNPEIGRQAAEESIERIKKELSEVDMLFIAAGMGGGTGTGASPVVAKIAKEMGILTIATVIKPFKVEGMKRMKNAEKGVQELESVVDALIVIENQKLTSQNNLTMAENYEIANGVLKQAVYCIVSILFKKGFINCDFADVRTILKSMGRAVIGYGEDIDPKIAADNAIHNNILENNSIYGAKNILINITSGPNIKASDYEDIVNIITNEAKTSEDDEPNIIFGSVFDSEIGNNIRVSVIAAGLENKQENTQKLLNNKDNIQIHNGYENIENSKQEFKEIKKVESPVFNKPLDEDELENDESFNLNVEDIPSLNDNTISFFATNEEKKKMNKTASIEQKKETKNKNNNSNDQIGLFDENVNIKKKNPNFLSRLISSIGPSSYIESDDLNIATKDEETEDEDIYNTPAIKRKVG